MANNIYKKLATLFFIVFLSIPTVFYVPYRIKRDKNHSSINFDTIWGECHNVDFYFLIVIIIFITFIYLLTIRYISKINFPSNDTYQFYLKREKKYLLSLISIILFSFSFFILNNFIQIRAKKHLSKNIDSNQQLINKLNKRFVIREDFKTFFGITISNKIIMSNGTDEILVNKEKYNAKVKLGYYCIISPLNCNSESSENNINQFWECLFKNKNDTLWLRSCLFFMKKRQRIWYEYSERFEIDDVQKLNNFITYFAINKEDLKNEEVILKKIKENNIFNEKLRKITIYSSKTIMNFQFSIFIFLFVVLYIIRPYYYRIKSL